MLLTRRAHQGSGTVRHTGRLWAEDVVLKGQTKVYTSMLLTTFQSTLCKAYTLTFTSIHVTGVPCACHGVQYSSGEERWLG